MSEPTDIDSDEEEFTENTLIEAIENQIESDNPPAAKATFNKLTLVGVEREEILNLMAHVLAYEIDAMLDALPPVVVPSGAVSPVAMCQTTNPLMRATTVEAMPIRLVRAPFKSRLLVPLAVMVSTSPYSSFPWSAPVPRENVSSLLAVVLLVEGWLPVMVLPASISS